MNKDTSFHILRLLETPGVGIAKANAVLGWANNLKIDLESLLADLKALKNILTEQQVEFLNSQFSSVLEVWDELEKKDVSFLSILSENYPKRLHTHLGKKAPPLLAVLGNKALLNKNSVGFCGSRKASEKGLATARDCSNQLALKDINIISGYAAGIDMATHQAALECSGTTTIVLAEGISHFRIKRDLKNLWDWERIVVISEFLPGIPWSVRNAMQRNQTICTLSQAMILIEAGNTGGSMGAGKLCLSMGIPLFAPVYEGMPETAVGNRNLLKQGAHSLLKSRKNKKANIEPILSQLSSEQHSNKNENNKEKGQLTIFNQS